MKQKRSLPGCIRVAESPQTMFIGMPQQGISHATVKHLSLFWGLRVLNALYCAPEPNCRFNADKNAPHFCRLTWALCLSAFCLRRIWQSKPDQRLNVPRAKSAWRMVLCALARPRPLPSIGLSLDWDCLSGAAFIRALRAGHCLRSPALPLVARHRKTFKTAVMYRSRPRLRLISLA